MNSPEMKKSIKAAMVKLQAMSKEKLMYLIDKHKEGIWGKILLDSGYIDLLMAEIKEKKKLKKIKREKN